MHVSINPKAKHLRKQSLRNLELKAQKQGAEPATIDTGKNENKDKSAGAAAGDEPTEGDTTKSNADVVAPLVSTVTKSSEPVAKFVDDDSEELTEIPSSTDKIAFKTE